VRRALQPHWARCSRAAAVATAVAATLLGAAAAAAQAPDSVNQGRLDSTVRFLQDVQNRDGGFGGVRGGASDPTFSAWVGMALAAAGINPRDQRRPGGRSVFDYVRRASVYEYTTDLERVMLMVVAAGADPRRFGGRDLVAEIVARQLPDGSFPHVAGGARGGINDTAFAILALSAAEGGGLPDRLRRAADWLVSVQGSEGGWGYAPGVDVSADMTGAVIQALRGAGLREIAAERRGWEYLRGLHNDDGGFGYSPTQPESNTASTAWVVQAMWAAEIAPDRWRRPGGDPLDFLASMQQPDGSIRWMAARDLNPIWMTAYAAPAFAGHPLPIPAAPRAVRRESDTAAGVRKLRSHAAPTGRGRGDGGEAAEAGGEVIAGGGASGADLFSRPQPQSQGETTGGERDVRGAGDGGGEPRGADGGGGAGARGEAGRRTGDGAGREVAGTVVAAPGDDEAAPGLRGARAGGEEPPLAIAVGGAALAAALLGAGRERRRPRAAL